MAAGWKFQFSDERVAYLKALLLYAANSHFEIAKSGTNSGFTRMSHQFSGDIAQALLDEINGVTG